MISLDDKMIIKIDLPNFEKEKHQLQLLKNVPTVSKRKNLTNYLLSKTKAKKLKFAKPVKLKEIIKIMAEKIITITMTLTSPTPKMKKFEEKTSVN